MWYELLNRTLLVSLGKISSKFKTVTFMILQKFFEIIYSLKRRCSCRFEEFQQQLELLLWDRTPSDQISHSCFQTLFQDLLSIFGIVSRWEDWIMLKSDLLSREGARGCSHVWNVGIGNFSKYHSALLCWISLRW